MLGTRDPLARLGSAPVHRKSELTDGSRVAWVTPLRRPVVFDHEGSLRLLSILWQSAPWGGISRCLNADGILSYTRATAGSPEESLYVFHSISPASIFNCRS